eukprot:642965-Alexandrium_andersonii.AAC.1
MDHWLQVAARREGVAAQTSSVARGLGWRAVLLVSVARGAQPVGWGPDAQETPRGRVCVCVARG